MKKLQIILWGMLLICCPMQAQIQGCEYEVPGNAFYVETGDVNGDGFTDVVIGHANNPFLPTQQNDVKISVMLNDGEGRFSLSQTIDLVNDGTILLRDFDNDGYPDIAKIQCAITSSESSYLRVYYNDGAGDFSRYSDFGLVNDPTGEFTNLYSLIVPADLNGDGWTDLIIGSETLSNCYHHQNILFNDGEGNFPTAVQWQHETRIITVCDLNNDGFDDIVEDGSHVFYGGEVFPSDPTLLEPNFGSFYDQRCQVVTDFDNDGMADICVFMRIDEETTNLYLYKNEGSGTFALYNTLPFAYPASLMNSEYNNAGNMAKTMNFDGDPYPDMVVGMVAEDQSYFCIFKGTGQMLLEEPAILPYEVSQYITDYEVADINRDGFGDLLGVYTMYDSPSYEAKSRLLVFFNDGEGSFTTGQEEHLVQSPVTLSPNPANDIIRIGGCEADEIEVYNTLGQLVKTVQGTNEISVAGLPEGVYVLRITDEKGNAFTERVSVGR